MPRRSLFIFRRDLRLQDNLGLQKACAESSVVYPVFILTPEQIVDNPLVSVRAVCFMLECLVDLDAALQLYNSRLSVFFGENVQVVQALIARHNIDAVYECADHTPYARKRSRQLESLCQYVPVDDVTLHPMGDCLRANGEPYLKYTPFLRHASSLPLPPRPKIKSNLHFQTLEEGTVDLLQTSMPNAPARFVRGGRKEGLRLLKQIQSKQRQYAATRNDPNLPTTAMSAYLKFGAVSIREMYWTVADAGIRALLPQLYWREFYLYIVRYKNTTYSRKSMTLPKMNDVKLWSFNREWLDRWKNGMTGCPIVDAGMRQLKQSGWMHNRLRMIVAQFLIFYLRIHWKHGEQHFCRELVDIDYCNNLGGWMWCAGSEVHSNPWYRVFSMDQQSKKYDPEGHYIRRWCPELQGVPAADLHQWHTRHTQHAVDYPAPIFPNLKERRQDTLRLFR